MLYEKMAITSATMIGASIVANLVGAKKNNPTLLCIGVSLYLGSVIPSVIGTIAAIRDK